MSFRCVTASSGQACGFLHPSLLSWTHSMQMQAGDGMCVAVHVWFLILFVSLTKSATVLVACLLRRHFTFTFVRGVALRPGGTRQGGLPIFQGRVLSLLGLCCISSLPSAFLLCFRLVLPLMDLSGGGVSTIVGRCSLSLPPTFLDQYVHCYGPDLSGWC
jgi:hypothetical protein